ncbi:MAG: LysR family transcriptional regulator [Sphingomonadaceae bacterium]|nr:LysR family transcriptional regulator [Sphingomonadaceae bacterium]
MLESRRLRQFLTVYELGSIGQASEKLLLTQPALSKSVRLLEDSLGVKLFERTTLGVVPTVFGKALAMHAKAIEAQVRHAEAQIASLQGNTQGQVSVGIGPSMATALMPLATLRIQERQLGIELSVVEGLVDELIPALRRGEIDLAIGGWPKVADPAFLTEVLAQDRVQVFARAAHPLAGRAIEVTELLDHPWALPPSSQRWRQKFDEFFFAQGLSAPKPAVVSNSAMYLKALMQKGDYLSFLPAQLAAEADLLVPIDVFPSEITIDISLTYKNRTLSNPACLEVAEILRDVAIEVTSPREPALTRAA